MVPIALAVLNATLANLSNGALMLYVKDIRPTAAS